MLRSYKYVVTVHHKLHGFVIDLFNRIEFESSDFSDDFFDADFLAIVDRHKSILKKEFVAIYEEIRQWPQADKTDLCEKIRLSNDIENICSGGYLPIVLDKKVIGINKRIRTLFLKLYSNVLDGAAFREKYNTSLREHFDKFRQENKNITLCPICGISELKTKYDVNRDQYDHYLPKSLYPFTSINFRNLVPTCKECNSFDVKGDKDTVAVSTGKIFYPYDDNHKGIEILFDIVKDAADVSKIQWKVQFSNPDGKTDEVESWKRIYNIENRYLGYVKGRVEKWYKAYWSYMNNGQLSHLTNEDKSSCYLVALEVDETECLSLIRKPALVAFLAMSSLEKAQQEAAAYT